MRDVAGYLKSMVESTEDQELCDLWTKLQQNHQTRQWHQLTDTLMTLVKHPEMQKDGKLYDLYTNVIADFEMKWVFRSFRYFILSFIIRK